MTTPTQTEQARQRRLARRKLQDQARRKRKRGSMDLDDEKKYLESIRVSWKLDAASAWQTFKDDVDAGRSFTTASELALLELLCEVADNIPASVYRDYGVGKGLHMQAHSVNGEIQDLKLAEARARLRNGD
jgi:hypothetical protein